MFRRLNLFVRPLTVLLVALALLTAACDDDNDVEIELGSMHTTIIS